ncbi:hypothetical protein LTS08_000791 [Lithohypha guttulata]|uniref:uncharacterized protein n=1 Tax=Lithohypha guttulata TaxID=1690604 RepID=UPI002DDF6C9F|nr:hypothetical protein LTR51_006598 [Lithohypha guttulata]KAK5106670.1 hypothetical protein LTS08_000791 [Lithohypha guttulata]
MTLTNNMVDNIAPILQVPDNASDYGEFGSDEEEITIIDELLAQATSQTDEAQHAPLIVIGIEDYESPRGVVLPKNLIDTRLHSPEILTEVEILRDKSSGPIDTRQSKTPERELTPPAEPAKPDNRSPLDRFRKPPKKALSVTDLVSPSWCELQYYYVLSKHGRKRRTPAMKQGSAVHQSLENEVHVTVPVETTTKEDTWGLRLWNICQGLKTLRDTGRTRELEIWGTVGGELVNGIIDELSYECPDPKHEESLKTKGQPISELPEYQTSITEYLLAKPEKAANGPQKLKAQQEQQWIYLTDVKTRATPTLPTGSSLRPVIVQLHLYHHMLENLAQGNFSLDQLTERYKLDPNATFSDSFLAQLGNLNQEVFSQESRDEGTSTDPPPSSQDSMDVLLRHNNLSTLWEYMMQQFRQTFLLETDQETTTQTALEPPSSQLSTSDLPPPPAQPTRLSSLLTASYLSSTYKHTPPSPGSSQRILGHKSFQFNPAFLRTYLSESLPWWRGEREAHGVVLQEAWKCHSCDFRHECSWIQEREKLALDEALERKKMREMAGVEGKDAAGGAARSKV